MSWKQLELGRAIHVKHGFAFKGEHFVDEGEFIVLTPGNFYEAGGFRVRPGKDRAYAGDVPDDYVLNENDLIVAMTEQGAGLLGSSALIPETNRYLHNQRIGLVDTIDPTVLDRGFLYYLFNTRDVRGQISGSATGTKVRHTAPDRIYRVRVRVPEVTRQKVIAETLNAYDDLIVNNRRRIELLEQSALLLFKEWFVHLRYPGHEYHKVIDGVPEGWMRTKLSDVSDIGRGASPRPINLFMGGTVPWFKIADATASESPFVFGSKEHVSDEGAKKSVFLEPGSLIISNSATCGLPCFTGVGGCIHDGWLYFREMRRVGQYFLYCFFHSKRNELVSSVSDGSTQKNLNTDAAGRLTLILPPKDLLAEEFEITVEPIFIQISTLAKQNMALRRARDLLLPRLMDGRLSI
jgi:type I restriction enzyme S subunit